MNKAYGQYLSEHKNLSLFVLLAVTILLTYIFEERRTQKNEEIKVYNESLFKSLNPEEFLKLEGDHFELKREKKLYFDSKSSVPLSAAKVHEFLNAFSKLRIERILNNGEVEKVGVLQYFPSQKFYFKAFYPSETLTFILGKKLEYEQSFYVQIIRESFNKKSTQYVVMSDPSPDPGVYETDLEYKNSQAKYQKIISLLMLSSEIFYDLKIFKDFAFKNDQIYFDKVTISTFRNKKFEVSFKESKTIPPPPSGMTYFEENWISFYQQLVGLTALKIHLNYKPQLLDGPLSLLEIISKEGKKNNLELYRKYEEKIGYFLKADFSPNLYELNAKDALYFLVNVQDFWLKRLRPFGARFRVALTFMNEQILDADVSDGEVFNVEIFGRDGLRSKTVPKVLAFKKLVDFFKSNADHVSELSESLVELEKKSILKVKIADSDFYVVADEFDLIICDLSRKIKYHHYVGRDLPFNVKYDDYI